MTDIKIKKVFVETSRSVKELNPSENYKIGNYLNIDFEIRTYVGYRTRTEYIGKFSYKMPQLKESPFRMSYNELEEMAYRVIKKEFGGPYGV